MTRIYHILLYLWQLPQNLLGLLFLLRLGGPSRAACVTRREDVRYFYYDAFPGGVTLGNYVFLSTVFRTSTRDVNHEWGHVRDSRLLGPLYLPVIGIPSGLHALWWRRHQARDYYAFWTERRADRRGGVAR